MTDNADINFLIARWERDARRHEDAAQECHDYGDDMDEERQLHLEIARTLRNCATELKIVAKDTPITDLPGLFPWH